MKPSAMPQTNTVPTLPEFLDRERRRSGQRVTLEPGQFFFHAGHHLEHFAVLETGSLRVFTMGANGREITLYCVEPGECCMVNVLSLISGTASPATAVAEAPVTAVVYPRRIFLDWIEQREDLRRFVFGIMASRVASMMTLVEEVAFQRLDCRLAGYLLGKASGGQVIELTHEAIAADLGTAREVVSRLLKSFERQEALSLSRGRVQVRNADFLRQLSGVDGDPGR
jgi:CRP/FNR family transcriptional regulator